MSNLLSSVRVVVIMPLRTTGITRLAARDLSEVISEVGSEEDSLRRGEIFTAAKMNVDPGMRSRLPRIRELVNELLEKSNPRITFEEYLELKWGPASYCGPISGYPNPTHDRDLIQSVQGVMRRLPLPPGALVQDVSLLMNPFLRLFRENAGNIAKNWVQTYRSDPKSFSQILYSRFKYFLDLAVQLWGIEFEFNIAGQSRRLSVHSPTYPEHGALFQLNVAFDAFVQTVLPGTSVPHGSSFLAKCASLLFTNSDIAPLMTPAASENSRRIRRLQVAANLRSRIENIPRPKEERVSSTKLCYAYLLEEFKLAAADQEKKHIFWKVFPGEQGEKDFYMWAERVYHNLSGEIHEHKLVNDSRALVRVGPNRPDGTYLYLPYNGSLGLMEGDFPEVEHVRYQALWDLLDQRGREGIFQTDYSLQSEDVRRLVAGLEDADSIEDWSHTRPKRRATGQEVSVLGERARRC